MRYTEFNKRIKEHLTDYKNNVLRIKENGLYKGEEKGHVLPGKVEDNFLSDTYSLYTKYCNENRLNTYSNHLNSSQIMCMNFFLPLFNRKEVFNKIISETLGVKEEDLGEIIDFFCNAMHNEKYQFDIYVEYSSGYKIFLETKYSEENFRTFQGEDKDQAWEERYKDLLKDSLYLKDLEKEDFYKDYQIYRNVALIKNKKDYVIFLYPFDNEKIKNKLNNFKFAQVKEVDWNSVTYDVLKLLKNTELEEYYKEFSMKYLNY
ncbi:MAG: hypothetical protein WAO56_01685 [Miniphocaeibacter sp.]|uniref:PGN_0703 family putative restriction endonuclease n=1 Tax=Miniphocaeibacter sp. TaxID=3100973 RepID=UPI0017DBAF14|nr:hypothetical protein [Gallicola sp.]